MLNKDTLLSFTKSRERVMDVPLFGAQQINIRLFTKQQLDEIRAESVVAGEVNNDKLERLLMLRGCLEPAFTDAEYDEIRQGNAAVYYALLNAVMEGNGLTALAQSGARRTFSA